MKKSKLKELGMWIAVFLTVLLMGLVFEFLRARV